MTMTNESFSRSSNALTKKQFKGEHHRVAELLDELTVPRRSDGHVHLLRELYSVLIKHFPSEHAPGGLFEAMRPHLDEHHELIRSLVHEHFRILSAIRRLIDQAQSGKEQHDSELPRNIAALVDLLHEHERKEQELARELLGD